jgi:hypothetical protein
MTKANQQDSCSSYEDHDRNGEVFQASGIYPDGEVPFSVECGECGLSIYVGVLYPDGSHVGKVIIEGEEVGELTENSPYSLF